MQARVGGDLGCHGDQVYFNSLTENSKCRGTVLPNPSLSQGQASDELTTILSNVKNIGLNEFVSILHDFMRE